MTYSEFEKYRWEREGKIIYLETVSSTDTYLLNIYMRIQ